MSSAAPPLYTKDSQQDPNVAHVSDSHLPPPYPPQQHTQNQNQSQNQGWRTNRQPSAHPAPTYVQPGTVFVVPMNGRCNHQWSTRFGLLGILCAIFFCPLGLLCLLCDRQEVCTRCGARRTPMI